jgi:transposase-like protein
MANTGKSHKKYWLSDTGISIISSMARDGMSNEEIAKKLGVAASTFYKWLREDDNLSEAVIANKELADRVVEASLYKLATGYDYVEDKVSASGKRLKNVKQHETPNITAIKMWLNNRQPKKWRDKREIELSGRVDSSFDNLGTDELIKHLEKLEDEKDGLEPKQS